MFTSGYLISRAAEMPGNIMLIYIPVVLTRAFGIGKPFFKYVEGLTSHNWVLRMTSFLRVKLFRHVEKDAVFFRGKYRLGDMLGILTEDIGHIQNLYLRTVLPFMVAWLVHLAFVLWLGFFSVWFALMMLLLLALFSLVLPLVSVLANGLRQAKHKNMKLQLYRELMDNVIGAADWIYAGRSQDCLSGYEATDSQISALDMALERYDRRRGLLMQALFAMVIVAVFLWASTHFVGVHFTAGRGSAANWIAAFTLCFFPLIDAFAPLPVAAQESNVYGESLERMNRLTAGEVAQPVAKTVEVEAPFSIQVQDMSFAYEGETKKLFNRFDLQIAPKEKIAILGRSGAGKSTLVSLLRGDLLPSHGGVTLNGVPVTAFGDDISRYIGVIPQQPYVFNATLLNNLRIGRMDASEAEVWDALHKVGLTDLANRLPEGLHTIVDEAGLRFSGGERQRLALARVILTDAPIIILDEPTVGLDPLTEQRILESFFHNLASKTIIWITHHLQGIDMMDRVLFIEDGRAVMDDTPQALLQNNDYFRHLYLIDRGEI